MALKWTWCQKISSYLCAVINKSINHLSRTVEQRQELVRSLYRGTGPGIVLLPGYSHWCQAWLLSFGQLRFHLNEHYFLNNEFLNILLIINFSRSYGRFLRDNEDWRKLSSINNFMPSIFISSHNSLFCWQEFHTFLSHLDLALPSKNSEAPAPTLDIARRR